ncbi:MAG: GrpB family protein [Anaerolineales bacterium]|nr:GrpB family protein [Anaerolineales bacterium]
MADGEQINPEQREVELVPHNPEWSQLAEEEAKRILEQLSVPVIGVYHIGSTSIPGIKAKPILDFVIEVEDLDDIIRSTEMLGELGYISKGEYGIPGRQFFTKDTDGERSHHLHVFQQGHPDIERHLVFRDFLRANPEAAQKYEIIKEKLAKRFPKESGNYTEAKSDFILSMDEVARYWLEQNGFQNKPPDPES